MRRALRSLFWALVFSVALCSVGSHAQQDSKPDSKADPKQDPKQAAPPVFRTGINYVRVDVIVSDKNDTNVADLKLSDFEVTEDGKPQKVENFKFIKLDGGVTPGPDGPPRAIRSDEDEEQEASRDDVRLFAIFLDDYHVRKENSIRVRAPIEQFIDTQLGPSDMIGLMYPLESIFGVRMSRNHTAVMHDIERFIGRKYDYRPTNDLEEKYMYYPAETQEQIRVKVSLSALKGLIVHMGTLKEGRKSLIVVSEGFSNRVPANLEGAGIMPGGGQAGNGLVDPIGAAGLTQSQSNFAASIDMEQMLRDVYDEANKNNVSLYTVDPRGLAVSEFDVADGNIGSGIDRQILNGTMDTLRTLAVETDGRAIINRNDLAGGMKQIVKDVSAYYLLGYNSTQTATDGKFHEIKVRVKRSGVQVRARKGYWGLTREEIALSTAAPKALPPPAVTAALANVSVSSAAARARVIRTWLGTSRGENGKTRVTFVWAPTPRAPGAAPTAVGQEPSKVLVTAIGPDAMPFFRERVPEGRAVFDAPPGTMQLRLSVEGAGSGVLDTEIRDVVVPDLTKTQTALGTPAVFRARTPRELQQMKGDATAVPATVREFSRTDRIFIRVPAYGAGAPALSAHVLNRAGQPMSELPVTPPVDPSTDATIDVPLAGMAPGEYVLEIKAAGEGGDAKELVGFRVTS